MSTLKVNTLQTNSGSGFNIDSPLESIPSIDVTGGAVFGGGINVTGVSTFNGGVDVNQGIDATGLLVTGITTLGQANITGLSNAGVSTLGNATASTLVVSGVTTTTNLIVGTGGTAITTVSTGSSVGIGSTLPQTKLDVIGSIKGTITSGVAIASTAGTSIDFTEIPSWVKRVTVMFYRISTNGISSIQVQLGDSTSIKTTGYEVTSAYVNAGSSNTIFTSGFAFYQVSGIAATGTQSGQIVFNLVDSAANTYVGDGSLGWTAAPILITAGSIGLSSILTRIRITTVNGTDVFDAGSINILFEG